MHFVNTCLSFFYSYSHTNKHTERTVNIQNVFTIDAYVNLIHLSAAITQQLDEKINTKINKILCLKFSHKFNQNSMEYAKVKIRKTFWMIFCFTLESLK